MTDFQFASFGLAAFFEALLEFIFGFLTALAMLFGGSG